MTLCKLSLMAEHSNSWQEQQEGRGCSTDLRSDLASQ